MYEVLIHYSLDHLFNPGGSSVDIDSIFIMIIFLDWISVDISSQLYRMNSSATGTSRRSSLSDGICDDVDGGYNELSDKVGYNFIYSSSIQSN